MPNPAAQGQPADTGGRNDPAGNSRPKSMVGMIDVSPGTAASHGSCVRSRINPGVLDPRQINYQTVVANPQAAGVMPTAADRQQYIILSSKIDAIDDVSHVCALRNESRLFNDHGVVNLSSCVVIGVLRLDQFAAQLCFETGDGFVGKRSHNAQMLEH